MLLELDESEGGKKFNRKKQQCNEKYDNLLEHIRENYDCEFKLKFTSSVDNFNDMSVNYFISFKLSFL